MTASVIPLADHPFGRESGGRAAVLCGLGTWVPPRVVDNDEIAGRLDTTDDWIQVRTGIKQRHVIEPGMSTSDLAVEAGTRALKSANLEQVDVVVLATTTPDRPCPASAPEVASRIGLDNCAAFDLNAVCTGFLYGLASGAGLIAAGVARTVLVIGADAFTTILNPNCRMTTAIFGDGAGAVVLRAGEPAELGALGPFDLGSDGEHADLIAVPAGGSRQRSTGGPVAEQDHYLTMAGREVFLKAVVRMAASAQAVLTKAGFDLSEVDKFVYHQANARILKGVREQLDAPAEKFINNIGHVGNTAAASVPLALGEANESGELRAGQLVLLGAFGGGLTWGSTLLRWPDVMAM